MLGDIFLIVDVENLFCTVDIVRGIKDMTALFSPVRTVTSSTI